METITIKAKIDKSNLDKAWKAVKNGGQKAVDRARARALKAGASAFTSGNKGGAPSVYNIKKKELDGHISTDQNKIVFKSPFLTVGQPPSHFSMTPKAYTSQKGIPIRKRKTYSATVKKGNKHKIPGTFILNPAKVKGGTAMLWERQGKYTVNPIRRVSIAQMANNPQVEEAVMKAINETYQKRLDHELERMGL